MQNNTQKSLAFLYTNNEKSEREIKESIPFIISIKRIKYLGINSPKETKGIQVRKNLKDSIRKLLELISEFSKVVGYKINTQKSLTFLYTKNEKSEREIKESIPFIIATKRIKYLGINLPKETKELYTENYKTLMKERHKQMEKYSMFLGRKN